jgi:hypothetical protein
MDNAAVRIVANAASRAECADQPRLAAPGLRG